MYNSMVKAGHKEANVKLKSSSEEIITEEQQKRMDIGTNTCRYCNKRTRKADLIYAHLLLNAQQLDKTLLLMFLAKLSDQALCEACSAAASGRFSKVVVRLYTYVSMNPGVQLMTELSGRLLMKAMRCAWPCAAWSNA